MNRWRTRDQIEIAGGWTIRYTARRGSMRTSTTDSGRWSIRGITVNTPALKMKKPRESRSSGRMEMPISTSVGPSTAKVEVTPENMPGEKRAPAQYKRRALVKKPPIWAKAATRGISRKRRPASRSASGPRMASRRSHMVA